MAQPMAWLCGLASSVALSSAYLSQPGLFSMTHLAGQTPAMANQLIVQLALA